MKSTNTSIILEILSLFLLSRLNSYECKSEVRYMIKQQKPPIRTNLGKTHIIKMMIHIHTLVFHVVMKKLMKKCSL